MEVTVIRAADCDGRCGQVAQDIRASECCHGTGRIGCPEILTNLHAKGEARQIVRGENQISAEGNLEIADSDPSVFDAAPMREIAFLVKFAVIGQIALGDHAEQLTARNH